MATVDTSAWGPTGPRLAPRPPTSPPVYQPTPAPAPAAPAPPLGTYPLPPGATWANPAPGYDNTGRPLPASSSSSSATPQDSFLALGQLIAAALGQTTVPPQATPTIATVPASGPASSSSSTVGILVLVAIGFGAWYWWTHRKAAKPA